MTRRNVKKYKGSSVLWAAGQGYGEVLTDRAVGSTKAITGEEQRLLKINTNFADKFFVAKKVCDETKKKKVVYLAFIGL